MAISEFDNPKILEMSKGLNVYQIGERKNLKNRRSEILITNYEIEAVSLFKMASNKQINPITCYQRKPQITTP
jgi:hypothetical protein